MRVPSRRRPDPRSASGGGRTATRAVAGSPRKCRTGVSIVTVCCRTSASTPSSGHRRGWPSSEGVEPAAAGGSRGNGIVTRTALQTEATAISRRAAV
jgi:hypothetical protein